MNFLISPLAIATTVLSLLLVTLTQGQPELHFTNCHPGATQQIATTFSVSPYPLCTGQNVCMTAVGPLTVPIVNGGTLAIQGYYLGRTVYTDNLDLCLVLAASGFPCPVASSRSMLVMCVLVKSIPLNLGVRMNFIATNGDGGVIFCQTEILKARTC